MDERDRLAERFEERRGRLRAVAYRMLGSLSEADDAVQETMVRAWRNASTLKAPGALRSWLYRIATNVCLSMLSGAQRRARPLEVGSLVSADRPILDELNDMDEDEAGISATESRRRLAGYLVD